jgi:hypothetical protein
MEFEERLRAVDNTISFSNRRQSLSFIDIVKMYDDLINILARDVNRFEISLGYCPIIPKNIKVFYEAKKKQFNSWKESFEKLKRFGMIS